MVTPQKGSMGGGGSNRLPIEMSAAHMRDPAPSVLEIDGETFKLVPVDAWTAFVYPPLTVAGLIAETDRERFHEAWRVGRWPLAMLEDMIVRSLTDLVMNDYQACRLIVDIATRTRLAPKVFAALAGVDLWAQPAPLVPLTLYGVLVDGLDEDGVKTIDKAIRSAAKVAPATKMAEVRAAVNAEIDWLEEQGFFDDEDGDGYAEGSTSEGEN